MTAPLTGLYADIYQHPRGNFSNHGLSARVTSVVVVAMLTYNLDTREYDSTRVSGPATADGDSPAVVLVKHARWSFDRDAGVTVHAQPFEPGLRTHWMAGGAFIASSDERFRKAVGFYGAVSLHDRQE